MSDKCCICGRFCRFGADSSTPFGDSSMLEPPEPWFYCAPCAEKQKARCIETGGVGSDWIKARWQREAARELGLVEAGPRGAAWTTFCQPKHVPAGYVVVAP